MILVAEMLTRGQTRGDAPAIVDEQGAVSWAELSDYVDRLCLGLVHEGMRRGRPVVLLLDKTRHLPLTVLAVLRGGAVVLPLSPDMPEQRLAAIVRQCAPTLLVYDEKFTMTAEHLLTVHEFRNAVKVESTAASSRTPGKPWDMLLRTNAAGARFPEMDAEAPAWIAAGEAECSEWRIAYFTSEELERGVMAAIRGLHLPENLCELSLLPPSVSLEETVLRPLMQLGTMVLSSALLPEQVAECIKKYNVQVLQAPASYYHLWLDWLQRSEAVLETLQITEARWRVPWELKCRAHRMKVNLLPTWTSIEIAGPALGATPGLLGTAPSPMQRLPGYHERIMDSCCKEILGGSIGELQLMRGGIAETIQSIQGDVLSLREDGEWWRSDMLARRHKDGRMEIMGTRYAVLLRDGKRVFPAATARLAEHCAGVRQAEPVIYEERPGVFQMLVAVVPVPGMRLTNEVVQAHLVKYCEKFQLPDEIVILDLLPERMDGQVDREALRQMVMDSIL